MAPVEEPEEDRASAGESRRKEEGELRQTDESITCLVRDMTSLLSWRRRNERQSKVLIRRLMLMFGVDMVIIGCASADCRRGLAVYQGKRDDAHVAADLLLRRRQ